MISIIVGMDKNSLIGNKGKLPWCLPSDLKYFKETTKGKTVVMGRKTFESIGKPLLNRKNVVLTSDTDFEVNECQVIHSINDISSLGGEIFIIGGATLYKQSLDIANKLYITEIDGRFEGDTYFPCFDREKWEISSEIFMLPDDKNRYAHTFYIYDRIQK